jgi:Uma2 family endonuclease
MNSVTLNTTALHFTDEQFVQLCRDNRDLRFERNANGDIIIMPPTGGETGHRNARIIQQLLNWTDTSNLGIAFDSSTGFKLPNGADRSPDAAWIPWERWRAIAPEQRQQFLPLCPDFIVELRSPSDRLDTIREKMQEYLENGMRLGWLIDPISQTVEIYRSRAEVEQLQCPETLSGEDVLPGFILQCDRLL